MFLTFTKIKDRMRPFILILFFAVVFSACSKTDEKVNIQDLNKEFISAWNSKDTDKLISYLAEDVQFLQGEVHFRGKSEVADRWVKETLGTISDLKTNSVSSGAGDEIAYEGGTYSVDVLPAGPNEPFGLGEGNYILLWKKNAEGEWKLSYAQLEGLPVLAR
jgi:ketosteroid isomerase-like protein